MQDSNVFDSLDCLFSKLKDAATVINKSAFEKRFLSDELIASMKSILDEIDEKQRQCIAEVFVIGDMGKTEVTLPFLYKLWSEYQYNDMFISTSAQKEKVFRKFITLQSDDEICDAELEKIKAHIASYSDKDIEELPNEEIWPYEIFYRLTEETDQNIISLVTGSIRKFFSKELLLGLVWKTINVRNNISSEKYDNNPSCERNNTKRRLKAKNNATIPAKSKQEIFDTTLDAIYHMTVTEQRHSRILSQNHSIAPDRIKVGTVEDKAEKDKK